MLFSERTILGCFQIQKRLSLDRGGLVVATSCGLLGVSEDFQGNPSRHRRIASSKRTICSSAVEAVFMVDVIN